MSHRLRGIVLGIALAVWLAGATKAQDIPGHHSMAGMQAAILTNRSVQRELKLDKAQTEKVANVAAEVTSKARAAAKEFEGLGEAERRDRMHVLMTAVCKDAMTTVRDIFSTEQFLRYEQIALQQRGLMAFADPEIQKKLKLSTEQKQRAHELARTLHDQVRELSRTTTPGKTGEAHAQGLALQLKGVNDVVATFNPDQKAIWKTLIGERFEITFEGRPSPAVR
jgi:hypothetical protein